LRTWGSEGTGDGQFTFPASLDVDNDNKVYVIDDFGRPIQSENEPGNPLQKFDKFGTFLAKFGKQGTDDGEFNSAAGVIVSKSGQIYVSATSNHRIQKLAADGSQVARRMESQSI
jgi:DNA-binding beta-propeller fold protein YncE